MEHLGNLCFSYSSNRKRSRQNAQIHDEGRQNSANLILSIDLTKELFLIKDIISISKIIINLIRISFSESLAEDWKEKIK